MFSCVNIIFKYNEIYPEKKKRGKYNAAYAYLTL